MFESYLCASSGQVAPLVVKRKEIRSPQCRPSQHSARPSPMQPPPRDGPKPPRLNDVSEDGKPPPLGEEQGSPRASPAPAELSIHTVPQPPPDNVSTSSGNKPASSSAEISRQPSSVIQRSPSAMQRAKSGMGEAARALGRTLTKAASRRFHITPADHFVT